MKGNILAALSDKSFVYAWTGEVFSLVATNIFNFFVLLVVFDLTKSNSADALVILTITIPSIIFGVIAGAYVDRRDKRKVLLVVNISRALLLLFLVFNTQNLFLLYVVSFVFSFITQFFIPAELPILPLLVKKEHLYSANALFGMAIYGSILLSFVLTGPLLVWLGSSETLILLSIFLILAAVFIYFMRLDNHKNGNLVGYKETNIFEDLKYTLALMSRTKEVMQSLFLLALIQTLILAVATIAPGYASSVLKIPVVEFPILFVVPAALGTIFGGWIIVKFFHSHSRAKLINIGIFMASFAMMFLPYGSRVASKGFVLYLNSFLPGFLEIDILHIIVFVAFILGLSNAMVFVPANTTLQEKTREEFRGKVYGFLNTFIGILSLVPVVLVGSLADIIGVGYVISGIGIFLLLVGLLRIFVKF